MRVRTLAFIMVFAVAASPAPAEAQQTVSEVLSFLLTNRSIPTGDFVQDARAAAATRDTISTLLRLELSELPVTSSASAFTYRLDRNLGTVVRSSDSFGPFLVERSLTSGLLRGSLALTYQTASFDTIDGRNLKDGTLIATASRLRSDAQPFDVESVTLDMHTNTMTLLGNIGVTDRLDIGAALPFVAISMDGRRVDTYRGSQLVQAIASASASGPGDFLIRGSNNVVRSSGSGLAIGAEARIANGRRTEPVGNRRGLDQTSRHRFTRTRPRRRPWRRRIFDGRPFRRSSFTEGR